MNIDAFAVKTIVEKEFMVGFASSTPFDVRIVADCGSEDGAVVVLNVFWPGVNSAAFLVSITIVARLGVLSVEIQNKSELLAVDLWESGSTLENVEKSIKSFVKGLF